jgi:hypothetical protein
MFVAIDSLVQPLHAASYVGRFIGSVIEHCVRGDDSDGAEEDQGNGDRDGTTSEKRFQALGRRGRGFHGNLGLRRRCALLASLGHGLSMIKHNVHAEASRSRGRALHCYNRESSLSNTRASLQNSMPRASKKKTRVSPAPIEKKPEKITDRWPVLGPLILLVMTLVCYWTPMTSNETSILWDAADQDQVLQNYLSHELHAGRIPFWSPYPWSGYPFLADPQVGAWYPLNWPFFLMGVSPHMLVVEHWLHAFLACFGAYFLAWRLLRNRPAAVLAGLCYGLSGFFTGHSSHTAMLQCAAWLPWLLLLLDLALESHPLRYTVLGGLAGGMLILAGHFQTILYSFLALGLFAVARVVFEPRRWFQILGIALAIPVIGTLLSAIGTGPGLELTLNSIRTALSAVTRHEGVIPVAALSTLVAPDFYGVFSGNYHGPEDITQYYFYAGILLVPLAIFGLRDRRLRIAGLLLIVPTIWYAMGQSAGLYRLVALLPGFSSVRAPVNIWFVPSLGLALLAAAGLAALVHRWPIRWMPIAVLLFFCADLFYHQSAANPLAYSRQSYEELYGSKEELFQQAVANTLPPLTRFDGADALASFGPLAHYFSERTEVTYGYGPLEVSRYAGFVSAMRSNQDLRKDINVSRWLDRRSGNINVLDDPLPRANFPKELVRLGTDEQSKQRLATLDPARQALVPAGIEVMAQDANGIADVREFTPGHYRIHYQCATQSLVRVGNAYFPGWTAHGWTAKSSAHNLPVLPVDYALIGVVAPAGEGDLVLDYHSTYFVASALVTLVSLFSCAGVLAFYHH